MKANNKQQSNGSSLGLIMMGVGLIIIIGIAGWFYYKTYIATPTKTKPVLSGKLIKIASVYWPGMYWVDIADKKGWFKEEGLNVELVDSNADYYKSLEEAANGNLTTNSFSLYNLINFNAHGSDLVMVLASDYSYGADAIVAKKEIKSIADLKGKRIGIAEDSELKYIFEYLMEQYNINPSDITAVDVVPEEVEKLIGDNKVDAVFSYEPFVSDAIQHLGVNKIFDTSQIPGISPFGYAFQRKFIEENPNDVQAFVNVWHKATEFIKDNPEEAYAIIAEKNNEKSEDVAEFTKEDKILDLRDNLTLYSYASGFESLHGTSKTIIRFLLNKGKIDKELDTNTFLDKRFIRQLTTQ